jgi:hypothetical protein
MAEIGNPLRRRVVMPEETPQHAPVLPERKEPAKVPVKKPVKVPEREPA